MVSDVTIHCKVTVVTDVTWMLSFVSRVVFASLCSLFTEITFLGTLSAAEVTCASMGTHVTKDTIACISTLVTQVTSASGFMKTRQ